MNHDVMMTRLFKLPRPYFRRPRSASPFSLSWLVSAYGSARAEHLQQFRLAEHPGGVKSRGHARGRVGATLQERLDHVLRALENSAA